MRVGVVQMTSTDDVGENLEQARCGLDEAVAQGAEVVALPENFAYLRREGEAFPCAQGPDGEIIHALTEWARELGVWLLGGTLPEAIEGDARVYNTSLVVSPSGDIEARYRKIHLFDVDLGAGGGGSFRESEHFAPGETPVVAETPFGTIGLSVCYDLRFPELYRALVDAGATVLAVPSAFAPHTGKDHWEVLLRARAIESQAFVIAAAQCGQHSPDRASYGRSMIIDPWGLVLAQAADQPSVIVAECRRQDLERIRRAVPSLEHRRLGPQAQGPHGSRR